ncbi:MAG TPA: PAS domain S-box protein, partial [Candidatus Sulfopaludibacter sp.]|nr:PAS domain S-box protein [Candidatus Sulfopaludibacter sp.]
MAVPLRINTLKPSPLNSSVFALALTAVGLMITLFLRPLVSTDAFLLFLPAVWLSAWFHGRTGGFTATAASAFAIYYFFQPEPPVSSIGFVVLGAFLTWITAEWRDSRRMLSATLSSIGDAVVATDRDGRVTFLNSVAEALTGWPRNEAVGKPASEIIHLIDERTRAAIDSPVARAIGERVIVGVQDHVALVSRSGAEVPVEHSAAPVRDEAGAVRGAILVFRDINKRRQTEEQATHAQKMEAVGRLAGGVAGDFNNVLTVITGYAELMRSEIPSASPTRRYVDEIIYAGERAAALTRHLLAFSRGQSTQSRVLDLTSVIAGMRPMLERLLGQNIDLILLNSPHLGRVKVDPAQIEQVVVNLASNARDAMPSGGKLVVETANVDVEEGSSAKNLGIRPGRYVMLAVSDTGVGMDPETRSRLFEPFFTTKAPGKGSGLGLATVYGSIKQADGQVTVYSQPN